MLKPTQTPVREFLRSLGNSIRPKLELKRASCFSSDLVGTALQYHGSVPTFDHAICLILVPENSESSLKY